MIRNKRLINLENGEPSQYIDGQTFYSEEHWGLVEGEFTDEMEQALMLEEMVPPTDLTGEVVH